MSANRENISPRTQRPRAGFAGLFYDEFDQGSVWLRDEARIYLPNWEEDADLSIRLVGECRQHPEAGTATPTFPGLACFVGERCQSRMIPSGPGNWTMELTLSRAVLAKRQPIRLRLLGVTWTNFLAWAARITGNPSIQHYRRQTANRQLRLQRIETTSGELIFDFSHRHAELSPAFVRKHTPIGLNIVGFLAADLGIGESARCMVRAADAAELPTALVPLKLHCKNPQSDQTYAARLRPDNPYPVNVVHIDPPAAHDFDHHQGAAFRKGKYNVAYWAWELPEFPDAWIPACDYFHEIWCPSEFVRHAIAPKVPLPVFTMPHPIAFARPDGNCRAQFGLPEDRFLFLFLYDLNSYSARKNPQAALTAFRASGLAERGAGLVIKVHNLAGNEADFAALQAAVANLPHVTFITETLSRAQTYQLQAACDCFISLHRAEGFGLAVAECMYLGKPVIATDWSATSEYLTTTNGCPVHYQLQTLQRHYGPYAQGATWAEPDTEHAAWWMRRIFEDRTLREGLGLEARMTIEGRFSPAVIGALYRRRLEAIAMF
jgi:glycosyltransferase involved in cell wall biosynthesis